MSSPIAILSRLVLGTEPKQRLRLQRMLTAGGIYLVCVLLHWKQVLAGHIAPPAAGLLTAYIAAGQLAFYAAIRSGALLHWRDAALTMPQMGFALSALAFAYRNDDTTRGILLMVVALVLVFGAFTLTPARCRALGWAAVLLFGGAMGWGAWREPQRFPPDIELIYFAFTAAVLPTIAQLAGQLSGMRQDLKDQQQALRATMAQLKTLATHDELTGLPNRRHVQDWIVHETSRSHRAGTALCLALIDLDQFKRINDSLGHAVGDAVLRIFAAEARAVLRDGDVLARWGGEEFLLVMPDTRLDAALVALARLRERLARPEPWTACPAARVTFSAGLTLQRHPQTLEAAVHAADEALYRAKAAGRDRIEVQGTEAEPLGGDTIAL